MDEKKQITLDYEFYETLIHNCNEYHLLKREYDKLYDRYHKTLERYTLLLGKVYGGSAKND